MRCKRGSFYLHTLLSYVLNQGCWSRGCGGHPQILADQLTLSQPRGADYAHQIILAPPDFQTFRRPWSDGLTLHGAKTRVCACFFLPHQGRRNVKNIVGEEPMWWAFLIETYLPNIGWVQSPRPHMYVPAALLTHLLSEVFLDFID